MAKKRTLESAFAAGIASGELPIADAIKTMLGSSKDSDAYKEAAEFVVEKIVAYMNDNLATEKTATPKSSVQEVELEGITFTLRPTRNLGDLIEGAKQFNLKLASGENSFSDIVVLAGDDDPGIREVILNFVDQWSTIQANVSNPPNLMRVIGMDPTNRFDIARFAAENKKINRQLMNLESVLGGTQLSSIAEALA